MILLDTHIWIWWVSQCESWTADYEQALKLHQPKGLGISAISCWEVAKLVERNRLCLTLDVRDWLRQALAYPGIRLLHLTPDIAVESTRLPLPFHRDPADQLIVATARLHQLPLLTADQAILDYPHVHCVSVPPAS